MQLLYLANPETDFNEISLLVVFVLPIVVIIFVFRSQTRTVETDAIGNRQVTLTRPDPIRPELIRRVDPSRS